MELVHEKAEQYAQEFSTPHDVLLQQIIDETNQDHPHANMLSGATQGKLLEFISKMLKPSKILEVGTFTGFSALCLAKGLQAGGILHTLELRAEDAATAQRYFDASEYGKQIQLHLGNALDIIPTLNEEWDLVFIDADKVGYIEYYELTLPKLKPGGWIIADNVLFHGQVLENEVKGKNAIAIQAFNEHIKNDNRVEQVMLTVRDGLTLIKKN
ncbi:MAG: O-methyltransferase [Sphingobacteriales bacterium]|nr:MAG: O-methyltransferase [Sphingobacteriales bacterium]